MSDLVGDSYSSYALFSTASRSIGDLIADVTVREVHSDVDTITVHPVETGVPTSDHVFRNPYLVEIHVGFSDSAGGYSGYSRDVYARFLALRARREPFDVSTGKRAYTSMLFGNITVITDEENENSLALTAQLQEIIITQTSGSSTPSQSNMSDPASTPPQSDMGTQTYANGGSGLTSFGADGPTGVTTGSSIGSSGLTSFDTNMSNFGGGTAFSGDVVDTGH